MKNENTLIKSNLCNIKNISIIILVIGSIIGLIVFLFMASNWKSFRVATSPYCFAQSVKIGGKNITIPPDKKKCEEYKNMSLLTFIKQDNQNSYWIVLATIITISIVVSFLNYKCFSKQELIVSKNRVYGTKMFGKCFNIPLKSISSVELATLNGIKIYSFSNKLKFMWLKNNKEIYEIISSQLVDNKK